MQARIERANIGVQARHGRTTAISAVPLTRAPELRLPLLGLLTYDR
jgi:hypothetical protein